MPVQAKLTSEQIQTLKTYGEEFKNWNNTEQGKKDIEEHREHQNYFKEKLSPPNLSKMTESEFSEIWKRSWASRIWGNKDWYVKNRLIGPNGIELIREELHKLLYGSENFMNRYDRFRTVVKGFGISTLSEFLNMIFPEKFCLWNDKPKTVLPFLTLNALPENLLKYNSATGAQYLQCIDYLTLIKSELSEFGIKDFVDLDIFFWHLFDHKIPDREESCNIRKN